MKKTGWGRRSEKSLWNKGRTSIQGQVLYVRSARLTARTLKCPGCFASLRSDKGLHPLRRFAAIPADFAIDAPC